MPKPTQLLPHEKKATLKALKRDRAIRRGAVVVTPEWDSDLSAFVAATDYAKVQRLRVIDSLRGLQRDGMETERARCLAICAQFPDNLMARTIAERIRGGR